LQVYVTIFEEALKKRRKKNKRNFGILEIHIINPIRQVIFEINILICLDSSRKSSDRQILTEPLLDESSGL
jgi:hypothetical protein